MDLSESDTRKRVKVYKLQDDGQWVDKGTGYVECSYNQQLESYSLFVRAESDGSCVLNSKVQLQEYTRQQGIFDSSETLILWSDASGVDLALSFQEAKGCDEMWEQIIEVQQRMAADMHGKEEEIIDISYPIPDPTASNIAELEMIFLLSCRARQQRELLLKTVMETDFLEHFFGLFSTFEDLESVEDLYRMSSIIRCILFLNHHELYGKLFQDEYYLTMLGILEYDREYPQLKGEFRTMFQSIKQKELIPIGDEDVRKKIQQVYKAMFIKDVALARNLEDSTFSSISQLISLHQNDIIVYIQNNTELLDNLFQCLEGEKKKECLAFLQELCTMVRPIAKEQRNSFYRTLFQHGIQSIFEHSLGDEDVFIRIAALSVLSNILENNPAPIRSYCLAQLREKKIPLIDILVTRILKETDDGLLLQLIDILKITLDTSGIGNEGSIANKTDPDLDSFLEYFYKHNCSTLFLPLEEFKIEKNILSLTKRQANIAHALTELLSFLITQHGLFSRNYFMDHDLFKNLQVLLKAKQQHIRLAAVRVYKTCISTTPEFYKKQLIKNNTFEKLLVCLVETEGRDNLLNSALLELFDTIRSVCFTNEGEGMKAVIEHLVTHHQSLFQPLSYSTIFEEMVEKYNTESASEKVDKREEAYFEQDENVELEFVKGEPLLPLVPYDESSESSDEELQLKSPKKKRLSISFKVDRVGKKTKRK